MSDAPQVTHFFIDAYCAKCKAQLYSDGEAVYCPFCGVIDMPEAQDHPIDAPPLFYPADDSPPASEDVRAQILAYLPQPPPSSALMLPPFAPAATPCATPDGVTLLHKTLAAEGKG